MYRPVQETLRAALGAARFPIDNAVGKFLQKGLLSPAESVYLARQTRSGQLEQFCQTKVGTTTAYDISGNVIDASPLWRQCGELIGIIKSPAECSSSVQCVVDHAREIQGSRLATSVAANSAFVQPML